MMNAIERIQAAFAKLEGLQNRRFIHSGWLCEFDSYGEVVGLSGDEDDVMPYRTIDAQLAILRAGLEWLYEFELEAPTYADGRPMSATRIFKVTSQGRATLALADAILGDA